MVNLSDIRTRRAVDHFELAVVGKNAGAERVMLLFLRTNPLYS